MIRSNGRSGNWRRNRSRERQCKSWRRSGTRIISRGRYEKRLPKVNKFLTLVSNLQFIIHTSRTDETIQTSKFLSVKVRS
jgi:hypothetical protein